MTASVFVLRPPWFMAAFYIVRLARRLSALGGLAKKSVTGVTQ